jgi:Protein kinase domain
VSDRVAGRYEIVEALGGGGTSLVHRARDVRGGPDVALKILRPQFAADPSLRKRFLREAVLARRLEHPAIMRVLDAGENAGAPYLVLELVRGETLRRVLDREGTLAAERALAIVAALASALDHAHGRGVLHRDLKPQNVFVDGSEVKLGDFGNARVVSLASVTGASLTWGTPEYVAPEVFVRGRADPRSDLYALGVVWHETLTGRLPWTRAELLTRLHAAAAARPVLAPSGAGKRVDDLIAELLSASVTDRPASGAEVLARLSTGGALAPTRKLACLSCGAPRPDDVPRCLACGAAVPRLGHTGEGRWRLVLDELADDAEATERLFRFFEPIVKPVGRPLLFITGNQALYSKAELGTGIRLPAVVMNRLDEDTARTLTSLCRVQGLAVRALEGTKEDLAPRRSQGPLWRRALAFAPMAVVAGLISHTVLGSVVVGALGAVIVGFGVLKERRRIGRERGLLELRDGIEAQPAAEALLTGAAGAARQVRAPEVRALFADVSIELYRLTRRAESLRARARAASSELALLERTIAEAPALTERLGAMAAHLDALDDALATGSEGELMQTLARLERAAGAPGADRGALAATRRDVEATLERRGAAEQERARLSAALCQLLGGLRQVYRRALTLETFDEHTARAVEAASAELDVYLAGRDAPATAGAT